MGENRIMKKKKRWIIGLSILAVLAAVIAGVFLYARSFLSAETAIRRICSASCGQCSLQ